MKNDRQPGPWWLGPLVVLFSAVLYIAAFPPLDVAEAAYIFAVPLLLWLMRVRSWRVAAGGIFGWGFLSWLVLIAWLRHVTGPGYVMLSGVLALYFCVWFLAAWWLLPRLREKPAVVRVAGLLALGGLWVVLEFGRTFFLAGFPWLPLAASHWQRPLLLQLAAWTGAYGVSFVLILFNLGLVFYLDRLIRYFGEGKRRFCPEFFVSLAVLMLAAFGGYRWSIGQAGEREELFHVSFVQPYIPQDLKWDRESINEILETLRVTTLRTRDHPRKPDLVIWPEAVTPVPILGSPDMQAWAEALAADMGVPLFMGSTGRLGREDWFNGIFVVEPQEGLLPHHYRKRKLVPYGEYIPLQGMFPWLTKIVPLEGSFARGESAEPIEVEVAGEKYQIGPLVCYEDVFPRLAAETAREGAELFVVVTNNAWYGEEGMPFQHAAHSVLRAVETRRPVLRVGNGGWSGWIDEYGVIRDILTDAEGSIFFRGGGVLPITRDKAWVGRQSFYVRHGDWFVGFSAAGVLVFGAGWWGICRKKRLPKKSIADTIQGDVGDGKEV